MVFTGGWRTLFRRKYFPVLSLLLVKYLLGFFEETDYFDIHPELRISQ